MSGLKMSSLREVAHVVSASCIIKKDGACEQAIWHCGTHVNDRRRANSLNPSKRDGWLFP